MIPGIHHLRIKWTNDLQKSLGVSFFIPIHFNIAVNCTVSMLPQIFNSFEGFLWLFQRANHYGHYLKSHVPSLYHSWARKQCFSTFAFSFIFILLLTGRATFHILFTTVKSHFKVWNVWIWKYQIFFWFCSYLFGWTKFACTILNESIPPISVFFLFFI